MGLIQSRHGLYMGLLHVEIQLFGSYITFAFHSIHNTESSSKEKKGKMK